MINWALLISILGLIIVPIISYIFLKGTVLDITHLKINPWPLLWYLPIFYILIPLVIVSILGIKNVSILYIAKAGIEGKVAFLVITTLVIYIISLGLFLRTFDLHFRKHYFGSFLRYKPSIEKFAFGLAVTGILMLVAFHFLGYRHALLVSIIKNKNILNVRLANTYQSQVPSQIESSLPLLGILLATLGGYLGRANFKKSIFYLVISLFILSAGGAKATPVKGFIVWFLAQGSVLPRLIFSRKAIIFVLISSFLVLGLVYAITAQQIPDLSVKEFGAYLFRRLGMGQMAGTYETFELAINNSLPKGDFWLHMIPGAAFVADYVSYQKSLMMVAEGYGFSEMGIKNSYFIAEAYAIGGVGLVFLSPIIVGFSMALSLRILIFLCRKVVDPPLSTAMAVLILVTSYFNITGGFSQSPLFKSLMLTVVQLFLIWIVSGIVIKFVDIFITIFKPKKRSELKKSNSNRVEF